MVKQSYNAPIESKPPSVQDEIGHVMAPDYEPWIKMQEAARNFLDAVGASDIKEILAL